jgi:hypothetical protein
LGSSEIADASSKVADTRCFARRLISGNFAIASKVNPNSATYFFARGKKGY